MGNKARVWLYKEGNECTTITGGWDELSFSVHEKYVRNYTTKESDNIFFNVTDKNGMCRIGCVNEINFSKFNLINIDINSHFTKKIDETYACGHIGTSKIFDSYEIAEISICDKTGRYVANSQIDSNENGYISIFSATYYSTGLLNKLNIYNVWLNAKEDVISINSQDNSSISFDCNNLDNLISLTQVDILTNGRVIQSYTENLDSITYEFDETLMDWGDNEISIQATYTQGDNIYEIAELISDIRYKKEVVLEEFEPVVDLPSTSTLKEVMQRFSVIESTNKAISNNLKNLLESKGFEVGDTPRLSSMVKLVNELSNNNSAEITEYINRITALESEVDNNKRNLYNVLVNKGVTDITTTSTFEQLIDLVSTQLTLIENKSVLMDTTYINSNGKFLNHTKTIITGYNNTAGFSIVGTQSHSVGENYMSGRLRCDFTIDFTDITSVSFFAKKVAQHGIVSVWISDGLPNYVLEENFTNYYTSVRTGYGVTDWTAYSMDTSNITGVKTLSFIGGYVDYTGNSASRTDYSNIILNYK